MPNKSPSDTSFERAKEDWWRVRAAIEAENLLVNNRQTWNIGLQTLLVAAFFIVFSTIVKGEVEEDNPAWVPVLLALFALSFLGIVCSYTIHTAIRAAHLHMKNLEKWWLDKYQNDYINNHPYINGIFEQAIYKDFNPAFIPRFFSWCWTLTPIVLFVYLAKWGVSNAGPNYYAYGAGLLLGVVLVFVFEGGKRLYNRWKA